MKDNIVLMIAGAALIFSISSIFSDLDKIELLELQLEDAQLQLELLHNGVCYGK